MLMSSGIKAFHDIMVQKPAAEYNLVTEYI